MCIRDRGDFSHKIEVASQDEIGVLTDTFNDMAGQLQDTLRQVENERNTVSYTHLTTHMTAADLSPTSPRRKADRPPFVLSLIHISTASPRRSMKTCW